MNPKQFVILFSLLITFACKHKKPTIQKIKAKQLKIDSTIQKNNKISTLIAPYKKHLDSKLDDVICFTPRDLTRIDGVLESSLGNLMADICFTEGNNITKVKFNKIADFVLLNYGGIRAPIPKGNITIKNAFEVMPFENELVLLELPGLKVKELLNYLSAHKKAHPISNLSLVLKNDSYQNVLINNSPFDENKSYFILTSDYLQQGGDKMSFLKAPIQLHKTGYKIRTALIDYFKKKDTVFPLLDNRFSYAK